MSEVLVPVEPVGGSPTNGLLLLFDIVLVVDDIGVVAVVDDVVTFLILLFVIEFKLVAHFIPLESILIGCCVHCPSLRLPTVAIV